MPENIISTTPTNETKTVFVVGFVTDSGTGGFEWSLFRDRIEDYRVQFSTPDTDVTAVREVSVPKHMLGNELTNWIDHRPELWEPTAGEGRSAS